ncbi:MAG: hypothetical protein UY28_C0004G0047 [Candidatus Amesbacteria bacterium GW2011_GWB1_48_13]|uniref:Uncharacterized protein n=1 Tax=Candidatus Amesbacteria bacterium GW2011_GWB1_48_13 TaxID=1618362 RepID=A0A0G1UVL6_9BACT|nr:MAG: hypothetical protein UY28_C0004G0047 [Candidatus Amesbacteria bacterium GW2011_GWB1_48_13]
MNKAWKITIMSLIARVRSAARRSPFRSLFASTESVVGSVRYADNAQTNGYAIGGGVTLNGHRLAQRETMRHDAKFFSHQQCEGKSTSEFVSGLFGYVSRSTRAMVLAANALSVLRSTSSSLQSITFRMMGTLKGLGAWARDVAVKDTTFTGDSFEKGFRKLSSCCALIATWARPEMAVFGLPPQ